jgi:tetratricopeptide (TPR) repeat protein
MFHVIICSILFFISNWLCQFSEKPVLITSKQESAQNFNYNFLKYISLGNRRMFADWIWVQTLLESDLEHYKRNDLNNWMYIRFNTILTLDPKFLEAYQFGGQYLSIIKDDDLGAIDIYTKGLSMYPEDYFLIWNTGFHYYYELGDYEAAAKLFEKILYHKRSPNYLPSILAKLKNKGGDYETALKILENSFQKSPDNSPMKYKFAQNILSLKVSHDLNCLNNNVVNCVLYQPSEIQYVLKDGKYTTNVPIQEFKLFSRSNKQ